MYTYVFNLFKEVFNIARSVYFRRICIFSPVTLILEDTIRTHNSLGPDNETERKHECEFIIHDILRTVNRNTCLISHAYGRWHYAYSHIHEHASSQ